MDTFEMLLDRARAISADAFIYPNKKKNHIDITIEDFIGFDSEWNEQFRNYTNPKAIKEFLSWLEQNADASSSDGLYQYYFFDGVQVEVGYTSFDI